MSPARKPTKSSAFRENVESIAWAVVMMLILRVFLLQAFRIPSESMRDTLLVGDFLFVSKIDYGPKIPFTRVRLPGLRKPRSGDVIVFQYPRNPSTTTSSAASPRRGRRWRSRTRRCTWMAAS